MIWFIRLRKAAHKKYVPTKLLDVEMRIQRQKLFQGVQRVSKARLTDYPEYHGSDGEESSEIEDPMKELYSDSEQIDDQSSIDDVAFLEQYQDSNQQYELQ